MNSAWSALVIDDDPGIRQSLRLCLETDGARVLGTGIGLYGTATVLGLHLGLRPVARRIDDGLKTAVDVETIYQMRVVCQESQEGVIRTILLRHVNSMPKMTIQRISTQDSELDGRAAVVADIFSVERNDRAIQDLMSRINIDPSVTSVSWEKLAN